ncbi:unnamed protein product [Coffea canephora]|uniref:Uncharacterized protein n=1 Tax=Coffea canephora TaxID=49390 RepID=A0A068UB05_COFCA|nr:unnamed protein product [Coffea canephora]
MYLLIHPDPESLTEDICSQRFFEIQPDLCPSVVSLRLTMQENLQTCDPAKDTACLFAKAKLFCSKTPKSYPPCI